MSLFPVKFIVFPSERQDKASEELRKGCDHVCPHCGLRWPRLPVGRTSLQALKHKLSVIALCAVYLYPFPRAFYSTRAS